MNDQVTATAREILRIPQRQSPLAVVFIILRVIRGLGVSTIVLAVLFLLNSTGVPGGLLLALALLGGVAIAIGVISWMRYTFEVSGNELVVQKGVLSRQRLSIPLERVQSISLDQSFLHRPVGLVRVAVDTAGTATSEFEIDAIPRSVAQAVEVLAAEYAPLRQASDVSTGDVVERDPSLPPPPPPPPAESVILKHTPARLLRVALAQSPWAGLALIAPLIAFADEINEFIGVEVPLPEEGDVDIGVRLVLISIALLILGTIASLFLQIVRELTTNWDLTLTKMPSRLRRTAGLFSRTTKASDIAKIQTVATSQTPVQRWVGLQNLRLHTIGAGDIDLPGVDDTQLESIRNLVLADEEQITVLRRRVSPLAVFLAGRNTSVVALLVALGLWVPIGPWSLLVFLIVPVAVLISRRQVRLFRWDITSTAIATRATFYATQHIETTLRKTDKVTVSQSFFERRRGLASIKVGLSDGSIDFGMIVLDEAEAVRDRAIYVAETNTQQWM